MIYKLNAKLRLGENNELFKKGNITKKPDGTFDAQLAIVCTADYDISKSKFKWVMPKDEMSGVTIGISHDINKPMNAEYANFIVNPLDSFKLKVNISLQGFLKIYLTIDGHMLLFKFTGQDASDLLSGRVSLFELEQTFEFKEKEPVEPIDPEPLIKPIIDDDDNYEVEPNIIHPENKSSFKEMIEGIDTFLSDKKWYFFAGCIALGLIAGLIL